MKQIFGFYRIIACYRFMEEPQLDSAPTLVSNQGLNLDMETTCFYLGREKLVAGENPKIARWRTNIFIFMSRNATDPGSFFSLPEDKVIEMDVKLEI
jgi:KUP system potassium uptake protein